MADRVIFGTIRMPLSNFDEAREIARRRVVSEMFGYDPPVPSPPTTIDAEDKIRDTIDRWAEWERAIAYKQLYNLGHRIDRCDDVIRAGRPKS